MKKALFFLLTFLCISTPFLNAHEECNQTESEELLQLANKNDSSVLEHIDGIFFLNPQRLLFCLDGIFLKTDLGPLVRLNSISFDSSSGYFRQPIGTRKICIYSDCRAEIPWYYNVCPRCHRSQTKK